MPQKKSKKLTDLPRKQVNAGKAQAVKGGVKLKTNMTSKPR
jgi:hypothetical protein